MADFFEVSVPSEAEVNISGNLITVKGPLGELKREFKLNKIKFEKKEDKLVVSMENPKTKQKAYIGTIAAHIRNMTVGVTKGYEYKMKIIYKHFPINVSIEGNQILIKNFSGEKKPRFAKIVGKTKVSVAGELMTLEGIDIEEVGQTAGNIEQATRIRKKDVRIFQDGIYLTKKGVKG